MKNTQVMKKEMPQGEAIVFHWQKLYTIGAIAAILAMLVNVLDVVLGFGTTEVVINGTRSAAEWFAVYHESPFDGLYSLGILNIFYMIAMLPVYFALLCASQPARSPGDPGHDRLSSRHVNLHFHECSNSSAYALQQICVGNHRYTEDNLDCGWRIDPGSRRGLYARFFY